MTRVLSELLQATEPHFTNYLKQLETLAGHPNADITLTTQLMRDMRAKINELGLDGRDTTGHELYAALGARLHHDEYRFRQAIGATSERAAVTAPALQVNVAVARILQKHLKPVRCYVLKKSVAKRLLRINPPKKAMKALGYRSVESMLKHESPAALLAAAQLIEAPNWSKRFIGQYQKLRPLDFELRVLSFEHPSAKRWQRLSDMIVAKKPQLVFCVKELATVVLLPLPANGHPPLSGLTTAALAVRSANQICAFSSYIRLHQLRPDFGELFRKVVAIDARLTTGLLAEPLPWSIVQQFMSRQVEHVIGKIFEPLIAAQEFAWQRIEDVLTEIEPSLEFWCGTAHLGLCTSDTVISCNLMDHLVSHANNLPFSQRVGQDFKQALNSELLITYMGTEQIRDNFLTNLRQVFAPEVEDI